VIDYITQRIERWRTEVLASGDQVSYGYRTVLGDIVDGRHAAGVGSGGPSRGSRTGAVFTTRGFSAEAQEIDQGIRRLSEPLQRVTMLIHCGVCHPDAVRPVLSDSRTLRQHSNISISDIADALGCHRDTVYARLHQAHVALMEWLQDCEIDRRGTCAPDRFPTESVSIR